MENAKNNELQNDAPELDMYGGVLGGLVPLMVLIVGGFQWLNVVALNLFGLVRG